MPERRDFASLMEGTARGNDRARRKLKAGEVVECTVLQVGPEWIFVDVGTPGDGRIQSAEFLDGATLKVQVGDVIRATVVQGEPDGPTLTTSFGRGAEVDASAFALALESGTPVQGTVLRALKGGLEVTVGRVQAFCPASLVELGYVAELETYVGQTLEFSVIELPKGRSPVLSRKALLGARQKERERELRADLTPGKEVSGVVSGLHVQGATVDLGGLEGFIPISELAPSRVERVEDAVQVGDKLSVRVLTVEDGPKGLRIRLSLRAMAEQAPPPARDEVLRGAVVATVSGGVIVATSKGEGFVPLRELVLAPGEDHRRAFPAGRTLDVVAIHHDPKTGRLRFSVQAVRDVEERRNLQDYSAKTEKALAGSSQVGSFGALLKAKFGALAPDLPEKPNRAPPARTEAPTGHAASSQDAPLARTTHAPSSQDAPLAPTSARGSAPVGTSAFSQASATPPGSTSPGRPNPPSPAPAQPQRGPSRDDHFGVVRRRPR